MDIKELQTVEDSTHIEAFKNMLKYGLNILKSCRISIEQYNKEIGEAV